MKMASKRLLLFDADQRKSLIFNAVPTLFNVPNPPKRQSTKRKQLIREQIPTKKPRTSTIGDKQCWHAIA
jgi:hypothetical protein